MRYRLRTLLIVLAVGPLLLASLLTLAGNEDRAAAVVDSIGFVLVLTFFLWFVFGPAKPWKA